MADGRVITLIVGRGGGIKVLRALRRLGYNTTSLHSARGSAIGDLIPRRGLPQQYRKEIVTVVVPIERADAAFNLMVETADINRPYGGFIYIGRASAITPYTLPDVPVERGE